MFVCVFRKYSRIPSFSIAISDCYINIMFSKKTSNYIIMIMNLIGLKLSQVISSRKFAQEYS